MKQSIQKQCNKPSEIHCLWPEWSPDCSDLTTFVNRAGQDRHKGTVLRTLNASIIGRSEGEGSNFWPGVFRYLRLLLHIWFKVFWRTGLQSFAIQAAEPSSKHDAVPSSASQVTVEYQQFQHHSPSPHMWKPYFFFPVRATICPNSSAYSGVWIMFKISILLGWSGVGI